jgi:hypothetical protein
MRALLTLLALVSLSALAAGLNDTGVTTCTGDGSTLTACTAANTGDAATYPRQDARFGRDAAQRLGQLPTKIGGGAAGFDFTPLNASGNAIALSGNPPVPSATPACVRDNVTGLIWEGKTTANMNDEYTFAGAATYAISANTAALCGATGWRVPTRRELLSIVHHGAHSPAIDTNYFPNTTIYWYWSSDIYAPDPTQAWFVFFKVGTLDPGLRTQQSNQVRLVRGGQ